MAEDRTNTRDKIGMGLADQHEIRRRQGYAC